MARPDQATPTIPKELYNGIQASADKLQKKQQDRVKPISVPEMIAILHKFWVEQQETDK